MSAAAPRQIGSVVFGVAVCSRISTVDLVITCMDWATARQYFDMFALFVDRLLVIMVSIAVASSIW